MWGDPGPEVVNGSFRSAAGTLSEAEMGLDRLRARDNGSPGSVESKTSSKGGVGKAL